MGLTSDDSVIDSIMDHYLESGRWPELTSVPKHLREEVTSMLRAAEALRFERRGAPDRSTDPVAAMLGLVPEDNVSLDPAAFKRALSRRGVKPSELVSRLAKRGWQVQQREILSWTTSHVPELAPALIRAVAAEMSVDMGELVRAGQASDRQLQLRELLGRPAFQKLAEQWASLHRVTIGSARDALAARALVTVHRGSAPDADQMLKSLEALLRSLDGGNVP